MRFEDRVPDTTVVLDALRSVPQPAWVREIATAAGMSIAVTGNALQNLIRTGRVVRVEGTGSICRYQVVAKPDLPRVHLQPGPLVPSVGTVLAPELERGVA